MRDRTRDRIEEHPLIPAILEAGIERGEPVYLVGGAIRDLALGLQPVDLDFATLHPYDMALFFAKRYGSRVVPLGKEATPTYRIPLDDLRLDWVGLHEGSLEADLNRRDFTINSIAYDVEARRFMDPTGGFHDLAEGRIRMASPGAFLDDPVRILKAFRMVAQLPAFRLDPETERTASSQRDAMLGVPTERLQLEMEHLFASPRAGEAVRLMAASEVLFVLVPELERLKGLQQNHYHHADVLEHTLEALEQLDGPPVWLQELGLPPLDAGQLSLVRLALLFHDAGKADTRTVDAEGHVHFYGHPKPSAEIAREVLHRLRFSNAEAEDVSDLCLNHLRPLALIKSEPGRTPLRRLIHSMGDLLPLLLALSYADKSAARGAEMESNLAQLRELSQKIMAMAASDGPELRRLPKLVDGLRAMEILGLQRPGPELGQALDALMERQVDGTITDAAAAEAFLRDWAARPGRR